MFNPVNWFGARYWLFMVPFMAGSFANGFKVAWFGFWAGLAITMASTLLAVAIFRFILDRYWTRKS